MGVIGPSEFNGAIRFDTRPRSYGLNRKLSVFVLFEVKRTGLKVDLGGFQDAEFIGAIRFAIRPRTSGLNRKF